MKTLIAIAGQPNAAYDVFTIEALRDLAEHDSRCTFDEETNSLWFESDSPGDAKYFADVSIGYEKATEDR